VAERPPSTVETTAAKGLAERVDAGVFRPLKIRKAVDEVISVIVDALHSGLIEPGQRLPREADMAERLEVSRNTVSEALARLEAAGVVTIRRGKHGGALVLTRSIPRSLLLGDRVPTEIVQLLQVRRPLEMQATLLTVEHASESEIDDLRRVVSMLHELMDDPEEFIAVDLQFHAMLGATSGNELLASYMEDLFRRMLALRVQYPRGRLDLDVALENQRLSMAAIESGDLSQVISATAEHLGRVEEHYLGGRLPAWLPRQLWIH
jgi:DNA-binding FadR family transcriptional regulator